MIVHSFVNGFQAKKTEMLRFIRLNKTPKPCRRAGLNVDNVDKFVYNSTFSAFFRLRCVDKRCGKQFTMAGWLCIRGLDFVQFQDRRSLSDNEGKCGRTQFTVII